MPWARAEYMVKKGEIDILPDTWYTTSHGSYLAFSNAYASNKIKFIKKSGDPFEYEDMASLTGKNVGVINGFGYGDEFMNAKTFRRDGVNNFVSNIEKLIRGRIDLTLEDEIVAKHILSKKVPELLKQIEFTKSSLSRKGLYVACGLANPRHDDIIKSFNKGLETIKTDGTLKRIFDRYGIH